MKEKRILVVDNESQRRDNLKRLLLERGMEALEAASCEEALELLGADEGIGLVLTETELPSMSGLFLLRRVKELRPEIEVILITHSASSYNLLQALRGGAFDFIVRPIDSGEILFSALLRAFDHMARRRREAGMIEILKKKNHSLQRSLKLQKALNASARQVAATTDIEELFRLLLTSAMRELEAQRGFLALFDRVSGQLGLKVCEGIPSEICRKYAGALPAGFTRALAQRGKPVAIPDFLPAKLTEISDPDELESLLAFPGVLAAPLRLKERVVGVVVLSGCQTGQPYGEHELNFLVQLSHHVALALEKAGIIHQLKRGKGIPAAAP